MLSDEVARQIIHGSPEGYDLGCQTRAGCANHHHPTLMTCFAAAIAVRQAAAAQPGGVDDATRQETVAVSGDEVMQRCARRLAKFHPGDVRAE